jgi:ATP-dependent exoDNAse (exonuclease V) alpha subunit
MWPLLITIAFYALIFGLPVLFDRARKKIPVSPSGDVPKEPPLKPCTQSNNSTNEIAKNLNASAMPVNKPTCDNSPVPPQILVRKTETFGQAAARANRIIKKPNLNPTEKLTAIPDDLISFEQKQVLHEIKSGTPVILVTGKAGTGKSTLIQHIRLTTQKRQAAVAFTGIAALNVSGQTIHSFFQFPHKPITKDIIKKARSKQRLDMIEKLELLIIDEISMVRADLLDGINWYLQTNRSGKNHIPFGGVQILMMGDPFQLPPFASNANGEEKALSNIYKTIFFFDALSLEGTPMLHLQLTEIFRQQDAAFIKTLNQIREGSNTEEAVEAINIACRIKSDSPIESTCLTPRRLRAQQINESKLAQLPGRQYNSNARYSGTFKQVENPDEKERNLPAPDPLILKIGAKVMLLKNDKNKRWVNGSRGTVENIDAENGLVQIRLDRNERIVNIEKEIWEKLSFFYDKETDTIESKIVGTYTQYPITHAWAATIHKAQGQTIEKIHVDLDQGCFADGQTYVALSRCPKIENITLARALKKTDIKVSSEITRFMEPMNTVEVKKGEPGSEF